MFRFDNQRMGAKEKVEYILDENGEKKSVVIPVETYEEMLEDIQDLVTVAERSDEDTSSLSEVVKNLKADGLL